MNVVNTIYENYYFFNFFHLRDIINKIDKLLSKFVVKRK